MEYHITTLSDINDNLRNELQQSLIPGEEVLWLDKPVPKSNLNKNRTKKVTTSLIILLIIMVIFETVFYKGYQFDHPNFSYIIGIILVIYVYNCYNREKELLQLNLYFYDTVYALTTKRAITIRGTEEFVHWFFEPKKPNAINLKINEDGTGDVIFETKRIPQGDSYKIVEYGFINVKCPKETYELAKEVALKNNTYFL